MTVAQLVTDVLVGQGVAVSNITVNGMAANQIVVQAGYFNSDSSNIGIIMNIDQTLKDKK